MIFSSGSEAADLVHVLRLLAEAVGVSCIAYLMYDRRLNLLRLARGRSTSRRRSRHCSSEEEEYSSFSSSSGEEESISCVNEEELKSASGSGCQNQQHNTKTTKPEQEQDEDLKSEQFEVMEADTNGNYEDESCLERLCDSILQEVLQEVILRARSRSGGDDKSVQTEVVPSGGELTAKLEAAQGELQKERSRSALLRQEMRVQEEVAGMRLGQAEEDLKEAQTDLDRFHRESELHRETFQKTLRALKTSLDGKESLLQEREESNRLLRKDLLDLMTQFNSEKSGLECKLLEHRDQVEDLGAALQRRKEMGARTEAELSEAKKRLEKRGKERRKLANEVTRLRAELEEVFTKHSRGIKVAKMLDHIENID